MFFKMLKSDLKRKKGLNIILSIFMMVAATLVAVSAIQVYAHLEGMDRSRELCNSSDLIFILESTIAQRDTNTATMKLWLENQATVTQYSHSERILIASNGIDFSGYDEDSNEKFYIDSYFLTTFPQEQNLVFDLEDQLFYVENGCIAIPQNTKDLTGAQLGDKVRLTTQMGYTYEFTITHFFKDCTDQGERFIISDADYQKLSEEFPIRMDAYELQVEDKTQIPVLLDDYYREHAGDEVYLGRADNHTDDSYIYLYVISMFMVILSIFMILIILLTIRFTMIAAIEEEEKEIGMMKAIGVDSFRFRWLYAAKYIAFSVIGGIVGVVIGIPSAKILLNLFIKNQILPKSAVLYAIAIVAVCLIVLLVIGYTMLVMQRINKISVMETIRGNQKAMRRGKMSRFYLHHRKSMKVRNFLAVSDLICDRKRYLFLLIAYTLGVVVILCTVHLKNSVLSQEFERYFLTLRMDYHLIFSDEKMEDYLEQGGGTDYGYYDCINAELAAAGIPARTDYYYLTQGTMTLDGGGKRNYYLLYGDFGSDNIIYREDGIPPKLENEIAISYYTAAEYGLELGNCIEMTYDEYTEDQTSYQETTKEFVITAFFDYAEGYYQGSCAAAIMGDDFHNGYRDGAFFIQNIIDAPEDEKAHYFTMIESLYGKDVVQTTEEALQYYMADYYIIFSMLEWILSGIIIFILILITYLNATIFLTEETPSISMLKSMGLQNKDIRVWQMLRMGVIVLLSLVIGNLILDTAGQCFVSNLFGFLGLTGFQFIIEPITTYLFVPVLLFVTILMTVRIKLTGVRGIEIWKIRNE